MPVLCEHQILPHGSMAAATLRAYWREHLLEGALPPLELPLDFARPARQTFRGGSVPVALPAAVTAQLAAVARAHGCTFFQLVLALWALLLCLLLNTN